MPKIDMGQAEEFEPLPKATYVCRVSNEWEWVDEDDSPSEYGYLKVVYTVEDAEFEGRKLFRNFSANPKSLRYMKQALIAMGADAEDVSSSFDLEDIMPELVGNPVRVRVGLREYEGMEQNEVEKILPAGVAA